MRRDDDVHIAEHGLTPAEVRRQAALLRRPPPPPVLERPAAVGDGIRVLGESEVAACLRAYEEARRQGRVQKFVPASGAATRMFRALMWFWEQADVPSRMAAERRAAAGDEQAAALVRFLDGLPRFAFSDDLVAAGGAGARERAVLDSASVRELLDRLLGPAGLDYATLPKGLLKFHRYPDGARTAFEEQLIEAAAYAADSSAVCRVHFTVSAAHLPRFQALLEAVRPASEKRWGVRFAVTFSIQKPSTDTIAVDLQNRLFRTASGELLFRPGGHGALIGNLNELEGDIVCIKNIDNVLPDRTKETAVRWEKILIGHLVSVQEIIFAHLARLRSPAVAPEALDEAARFAAAELLIAPPPERSPSGRQGQRQFLLGKLERPLRVCGVVRNTGEPGGGPFWVRGKDGAAAIQIVEHAQVDPDSKEQQARFAAATHFNPVDMACAVRDDQGRCFGLAEYVDPDAVFISDKSYEGRPLKALEHPGLWNGAMADWTTVCVEIPGVCFAPVKTVNDFLRPEHQPDAV